MAGHKNKGMLKGIRPKTAAPNFKAGEKRTIEAAHKGGQARKEQIARFKSLREAAEALRDIPTKHYKLYPDMSNGVATVMAMYEAAQMGDSKAATFLANLMGEMVEKVEAVNLPVLRDDIPRAPDPPKPVQPET